jgi:hypothetical protein
MQGLTRRRFLRQSGLAALASAGAYGLVERLATAPARAFPARAALPAEQHVLHGLRIATDNGIEVVVPPVHHQIVTARLTTGRTTPELRDARRELEQALLRLERSVAPAPTGLSVTVGWGRSYFEHWIPRLADGRRFPDYLPVDERASRAAGEPRAAFLDSIRFPSDPHDAVLEQNDVCFLFRSDSLERVTAGSRRLFADVHGLFELTSIRRGFVGGGEKNGQSLPKRMALKASLPGAELMPDTAQLFLGFTSTQRRAMGADLIANLETLPRLTDQWPDGYFRSGTTMHVSHLFEDLETWYESFSYIRRVWAAFRPAVAVPDGTLTVPEGPPNLETRRDVGEDARGQGLIGHSGALQPATRLPEDTVDNHGIRRAKGAALIQRADFNTLDNPFFWSSQRKRDRMSASPAAGVHFVAFAATSDMFHRARLAMDGRYSGGDSTPFDPRAEEQGLNSVLRTTHRQNFLVPPRRHRSFPLAELL